MRESFPPITINFASVKIIGIPGLSLFAIVAAIAVEFPEARWLLLSGLAGGVMLAAAMIFVRRRRRPPVSNMNFPALREPDAPTVRASDANARRVRAPECRAEVIRVHA